MNPPDARPAFRAGWADALLRGFVAFLAMAGLGQVLALAVWALGGTGRSFGAFARVGWLYVGAFHHVAVRMEARVAFGTALEAPSGTERASVSVGVAVLAATALALWLLFRAGRGVADRAGGGVLPRMGHGAKVAPAYAAAMFVPSLVVTARMHVENAVVTADVRASLDPWQALVLPLLLAALAGAAGGLRSALEDRPGELRREAAVAEGGWRMFVTALGLAYGGLLAAGVVQPDEPVALLTPSSARYYQEAFARPKVGALILAHHVGLAPNEAVWTLVPAMGACDGVWGDERADLLCYGRFPTGARLLPRGVFPLVDTAGLELGRTPAGYWLFLLAPAAATVLGGRHAAERAGAGGGGGALAGALAGIVFAALVAVAALVSVVTVRYEVEGWFAGRVLAGPNLVAAPLLALAWGVVGGGLGGLSAGRGPTGRPSGSGSRSGGTPPR